MVLMQESPAKSNTRWRPRAGGALNDLRLSMALSTGAYREKGASCIGLMEEHQRMMQVPIMPVEVRVVRVHVDLGFRNSERKRWFPQGPEPKAGTEQKPPPERDRCLNDLGLRRNPHEPGGPSAPAQPGQRRVQQHTLIGFHGTKRHSEGNAEVVGQGQLIAEIDEHKADSRQVDGCESDTLAVGLGGAKHHPRTKER